MVRQRLLRILFNIAIIFIIGGIYYSFFHYTGIGFVCPIYFMTGWKCPGCGITHMCIALLHLDFASAFEANPALLLLSPFLLIIFVWHSINYIQTGRRQMNFLQNLLVWICIVIFTLYGIGRNVYSFFGK
ncbi:MAG TPA: DUF2752 domain-containing protein [Lachnospiraceae bacterium]|nr:DUF2752 domain-containing protein [Lachnospiraceae bacterium]